MMKVALARQRLHGLSADALWTAVESEWERLKRDTTLTEALYRSLPARVSAVIKSEGDVTRYQVDEELVKSPYLL